MGRNRFRRLVIDQHTYFWRVGHDHTVNAAAEAPLRVTGCYEYIDLRRHDTAGRLRIIFRPGPDRLVSDGYPMDDGMVARPSDATYLNLHRPGVARAFLDEALAAGWSPDRQSELDGWSLFDAVLGRVTPDSWTPFTSNSSDPPAASTA